VSFQAMTWALKQKLPTPHERWILVAIANYANEEFEAWPSKSRIADDTGYSQSTICKYLASLEEAGIIEIVERFVDGAQTTSTIRLLASPPDGPPARHTDSLSVRRKKGVRATDNPCPPDGHKPITEPISEPSARAGAREAGASPARAQGKTAPSLAVRRGDPSWSDWMAKIGADKAAKAESAGEIAVTALWPERDGARFIGVLAP